MQPKHAEAGRDRHVAGKSKFEIEQKKKQYAQQRVWPNSVLRRGMRNREQRSEKNEPIPDAVGDDVPLGIEQIVRKQEQAKDKGYGGPRQFWESRIEKTQRQF